MVTRAGRTTDEQGTARPGPGPRRQALGRYGEDVAARHLQDAGLVLLDRNWRGPSGEIDLVLRDGRTLVVCEVKTRSSTRCGNPHEAVDELRLRRLARLGLEWLRAHGLEERPIRLDLVAVMRSGRGAASVEHVAGLL